MSNEHEKKILTDRLHENNNQFHSFRERYTYYILAINSACIGLSVSLTKETKLTLSLIPLAIAIILWMISFYSGLKKLKIHEGIIIKDFNRMEAKLADEPNKAGMHFKEINILYKKFERHSKLTMTCLYLGVVIFIFWNILNMYLRT